MYKKYYYIKFVSSRVFQICRVDVSVSCCVQCLFLTEFYCGLDMLSHLKIFDIFSSFFYTCMGEYGIVRVHSRDTNLSRAVVRIISMFCDGNDDDLRNIKYICLSSMHSPPICSSSRD